MKIRTLPLLAAVLLTLAGPAIARGAAASQGRLDRSFGHDGLGRVPVPKEGDELAGFEIAASGRAHVLYGSSLIALDDEGSLDRSFGGDGRIAIDRAPGAGRPRSFAIDPEGRILLAGSTRPFGRATFEAYLLRLTPDGARDAEFGVDGEVDTDFGLPGSEEQSEPNVRGGTVVVDATGRPLIGGSYGVEEGPCGPDFESGTRQEPFVGRLTDAGEVDEGFGEAGHTIFEGDGVVGSLGLIRGGGTAVVNYPCSGPPRFESRAPYFTSLDGDGEPRAKERGLFFTYLQPEVDPQGRVVELESPPAAAEEGVDALVRFLPNGPLDRSFGDDGRVPTHFFEAFAIDAQSRMVTAPGVEKIELRRFLPDGRIDKGFGPGGRLTARGAEPSAIALDGQGRIYTASLVQKRSRAIVEVARFIPGR